METSVRLGMTADRLVRAFNGAVTALTSSPVVGPLIRRRLITITYVGRRSGRSFTTPVEYRRSGDVVTIGVQFPDAKNWWRNFLDGGPITLHLDGGDRTGHATARRDGPRRATVTVQLDPVTT
jgi:hypothetical protein